MYILSIARLINQLINITSYPLSVAMHLIFSDLLLRFISEETLKVRLIRNLKVHNLCDNLYDLICLTFSLVTIDDDNKVIKMNAVLITQVAVQLNIKCLHAIFYVMVEMNCFNVHSEK